MWKCRETEDWQIAILAGSSNGRTPGFGPGNLGSSPSPAARGTKVTKMPNPAGFGTTKFQKICTIRIFSNVATILCILVVLMISIRELENTIMLRKVLVTQNQEGQLNYCIQKNLII